MPEAESAANSVEAVTGCPSAPARASPVSLSMRVPTRVYVSPGMRPDQFTVSTREAPSAATAMRVPLAASARAVPTAGTHAVWPPSSMSAWEASTAPPVERASKATRPLPEAMASSTANVTVAVPEASAGASSVEAVTGLPSASSSASPVALSMRAPERV